MGNFGLRISKDGVDVKTGADKDMIISSKYSLLKGSLSGTTIGTAINATTTTITIVSHNLGYIPMFQVFLKYSTENNYRLIPVQTEIEFSVLAYSDNNTLFVKIYNNTGANKAVTFKYFIFIDKGKM